MQLPKFMFCSLLVSLLVASNTVHAQSIPAPDDARFSVRVDLAAIQETNLGKKLLNAVRMMAAEELGDGKDPKEAFEGIEKALGFDPFTELRSITIFGRDMEDPTDGLQGVVGMGDTTGNLEGLLLTLPGYDSTEHGDHVIHTVSPDDDFRLFGAIHGRRNKRIVIGTSLKSVQTMLDDMDNQRSVSPSDLTSRRDDADSLVTVRLLEIPKLDLEGPPEALLKLVKDATLHVRAYGDDMEVELNIVSDTEKHAEQLQQLAQGAAAMVDLARDVEEDDEDLEMVASVLETLKAERDDDEIHLRLRIPEDLVIEFLREEADLPLGR